MIFKNRNQLSSKIFANSILTILSKKFYISKRNASDKIDKFITDFPVAGDNVIDKKIIFSNGKVYINKTQYFDNVPELAWEFYIGGYQPAQKWLKDRKDRTLTEEDINHYQKIIVALVETDRIMKDIDKTEIE